MNENRKNRETSERIAKVLTGMLLSVCIFQCFGFYSQANELLKATQNAVNLVKDILGWAALGITAWMVLQNFARKAWIQAGVILLIGGLVTFLMFNLENIKTWGNSLGTYLFN